MPIEHKKTGSSRKKALGARKRKEFSRVPAEEVLGDPGFDEKEAWLVLLQATTTTTVIGEDGERKQITIPDYRIRMAALTYLTDKRDGKAGQAMRWNEGTKAEPLDDPRLADAVEKLLPPVEAEASN